MKILSLFCNVGFGEYYFKENGINVVVANELLEDRSIFYKALHGDCDTEIITGDISDELIKKKIISACNKHGPIDLVMATPPCQGMSLANATKASNDPRNTLIVHAMEVFLKVKANYMMIENVPNMPKTYIYHEEYGSIQISDYIEKIIPTNFKSRTRVLNGKFFDTAQERKRSITLISENNSWKFPENQEGITTLCQKIKDLPSLEANCSSDLKWHFSSKHNSRHIDWMKHTEDGRSAYFNTGKNYPSQEICNPVGSGSTLIEFIKKTNGEDGWHTNPPILLDKNGLEHKCNFTNSTIDGKDFLRVEIPEGFVLKREIYGFTTAYKRMDWNKPAPTVTMTNGSISSQNNVHPGRPDAILGTYSDARVLTIREILIVCGLPPDALDKFAHKISNNEDYVFKFGDFGYDYTPSFIRKVLGELFLPKMALALVKPLVNTCSSQRRDRQMNFDF